MTESVCCPITFVTKPQLVSNFEAPRCVSLLRNRQFSVPHYEMVFLVDENVSGLDALGWSRPIFEIRAGSSARNEVRGKVKSGTERRSRRSSTGKQILNQRRVWRLHYRRRRLAATVRRTIVQRVFQSTQLSIAGQQTTDGPPPAGCCCCCRGVESAAAAASGLLQMSHLVRFRRRR
jgi:hypothetical protein